MSRRILVSSLIGLVAFGGITAGGLATASAATKPTLENGSAHYVAPAGGSTGSLTFTADVSDDSGIQSLKVIAWPTSSKLDPTAEELQQVDGATCRSATAETSRCTYTLQVTQKEAGELAEGTWNISALATAKDKDTTFLPRAAAFDVIR
ncbi:DUF5707 domain-containing protein [Streptomyces sp. NPDC050287]|uniref:DUF5707 domain-containing protein n=1 Tax=Streptomyces sp. NPDC050287 TaxID=3365608 RepID=UPI003792DD8A